jgi:hypothetical protein
MQSICFWKDLEVDYMKLYNIHMADRKYLVCSDNKNNYYVKNGIIEVSNLEDIKYFKERQFVEIKEEKSETQEIKKDKIKRGD